MVPIAGVALTPAPTVAGGKTVGIGLVRLSGDAGTGDAKPARGRPAIDEASHPFGSKGAAGHVWVTDPNNGSFM
jgi:hypothetical protein